MGYINIQTNINMHKKCVFLRILKNDLGNYAIRLTISLLIFDSKPCIFCLCCTGIFLFIYEQTLEASLCSSLKTLG